MTDRWFDDAAGPVVRPYAMTRGRTRISSGEVHLDLIALVIAQSPDGEGDTHPLKNGNANGTGHGEADAADQIAAVAVAAVADVADDDVDLDAADDLDDDLHADSSLAPEHIDIVARCRRAPQSVAELAAELKLPVGVVRVLIGDLIDGDWVRVSRPVPPAELPDASILREVIDGLRAL